MGGVTQGAVHMVLGVDCKRDMVGTGLENTILTFLEALSRCLPTENADYCMLVNEWAWLRSRVCLFFLKVHLGSVSESELTQE